MYEVFHFVKKLCKLGYLEVSLGQYIYDIFIIVRFSRHDMLVEISVQALPQKGVDQPDQLHQKVTAPHFTKLPTA